MIPASKKMLRLYLLRSCAVGFATMWFAIFGKSGMAIQCSQLFNSNGLQAFVQSGNIISCM